MARGVSQLSTLGGEKVIVSITVPEETARFVLQTSGPQNETGLATVNQEA